MAVAQGAERRRTPRGRRKMPFASCISMGFTAMMPMQTAGIAPSATSEHLAVQCPQVSPRMGDRLDQAAPEE